MNKLLASLAVCSGLVFIQATASGFTTETLIPDWQFRRDHDTSAVDGWQKVRIPHDWAISGPFSRENDLQKVAIVQNGENTESWKTGRSGGLPYMGKGCYRTVVNVPDTAGRVFSLLFDGAMSEAQVFVNGVKAGEWPYGYNSFSIPVRLKPGDNTVTVLLENRPQSSRWYPGAGLYRKVRLVSSPEIHVPVWGTFVTTPHIDSDKATVCVTTSVEGLREGEAVTLETSILAPDGNVVASATDTRMIQGGIPLSQHLTVPSPELWSCETPSLYRAVTRVMTGGAVTTKWGKYPERGRIDITHGHNACDSVSTVFGIRSIEVRPGEGFFLNGERTMFRGVCLHHDLGPLGAAVNLSAIRRQLTLLQDMGCNAVRTSHNMPAEELVQLCDEMGIMLMLEPFDEWDVPKCANGYHRFFNEWSEKDMTAMLRHFRNNPSVVMWSIGNEVPSQWAEGGREVARRLQDICHREDPTRPVSCGMDQFDAVMNNGFAAQLDFPSFNYKVDRYLQAIPLLPQGVILTTESASTVSSRGVYHFPAKQGADILTDDHHSSSYDLECCLWSNIPDWDLAADEDWPWMMGQFVWTGFDYLGEPSPYDTDAWPNHSSMFGIIDLASIPKDRYWLYRSIWNTESPTLHILPHWTWPGREGIPTPVYVYTSYPSAELFLNGVSLGIRSKTEGSAGDLAGAKERFRLMWNDVVYQKGELKVVAFDSNGQRADSSIVRTAGKPYALKLEADREVLDANGEDLAYITVSVVDRDGNECPADTRLVNMSVGGCGAFEAVANGDPTCVEPFQKPCMHLFSGKLCFIVRSSATGGKIQASVSAKGLRKASIEIECQ